MHILFSIKGDQIRGIIADLTTGTHCNYFSIERNYL